ncbi:MAG: TetR/AcrR family transcriptional regulator [Lachnospiraceae bacterium]|jgi:AcrR family transcriptional regulator|nr:TetR/AcrR family transcriptional regulator [Lachnospiraceae bacterium]
MARKPLSTKAKIIKAAWSLFYKKGYDGTTIADIISASKTSKGTFYHYFHGKDALLNTISDLFDQRYEELYPVVDPTLSSRDKLLLLNHEVFYLIETSVDATLLGYMYAAQLTTKERRALSDKRRLYFRWCTEIIQEGINSGEFKNTSTANELMDIYAMYERALLYDWALSEGTIHLVEYSDKLLPHLLDVFVAGV